MDRLFLDANVLFSAAWAENSSFRRLWRLHNVTVLTCPYAIGEVQRNLEGEQPILRLNRLLALTEIVADAADEEIPAGIELDQKDRPILAAAIRARATHLITGDRKDFGKLFGKSVRGVRVVRPSEYK